MKTNDHIIKNKCSKEQTLLQQSNKFYGRGAVGISAIKTRADEFRGSVTKEIFKRFEIHNKRAMNKFSLRH